MFTNQKWDINSANKQEVNSYNGINIADCSKSIMISNDEKEANAKLISAAPELLEAVKITLSWIKTGKEFELSVKNRCEEALEKAGFLTA